MFNISNETPSMTTPVCGGPGGISSTTSYTSSSNLTNVTDQMNSINLIISKLGRIFGKFDFQVQFMLFIF
jgi:hypothetical protein